jgi:hypothetical protein
MKCTTLFMAVGRGPKQPLASVDEHTPNGDEVLTARQSSALADQIKAGVDPSRISFEREERDGCEDTQAVAQEKPAAAKRKR